MARKSAAAVAAAAAPAPPPTASKDVVSKYQALCVGLDTLANAAHTASYAAAQYMEAAFPGLQLGNQQFFGGFPRPSATGPISGIPHEGEEEVVEEANPAKRRKRVKSTIPRDPNAPKKPLTAYFAFAKVARPQVVTEMPSASNKEITEELALRWANMKDTGEQQPFRDQYAIDMKGYTKLLAIYKAKLAGLPAPEEEEVVEPEPELEPEVEEEEEEEPAPPPKPVTPKSTKSKKEASSRKKGKDKEKATPKEKSSRKRSTKEVTPPPSAGEEEEQAVPATKSPRKRKRKAAD